MGHLRKRVERHGGDESRAGNNERTARLEHNRRSSQVRRDVRCEGSFVRRSQRHRSHHEHQVIILTIKFFY